MPSVDADHGEINPAEFMPQPTGHCPSLKADALGMRRMFAKQAGQSARIRFNLSLEYYLSALADHAHRSFPLRDVQPDILLHDSSSESFDCESSTITELSCATSVDRNYVIVFKFCRPNDNQEAKRCGAFSIRAKILAYKLRETETKNFHAVVSDAEIVEISLTNQPANPASLVRHRSRAAPIDAYLGGIGDYHTLMIKRIGIAQQMAELIQQTCQRREPPEPTRQRVSDDTPRAAARVNPHPALAQHRPVSDFTKLVRQLNNRGEASA